MRRLLRGEKRFARAILASVSLAVGTPLHAQGALVYPASSKVRAESATVEPSTIGSPIEIGRIHEMRSNILGQHRRLAVYLPQSYSSSKRAYPVVYLLDGGPDEDFHHITGMVRVSAAYETTEEVIVIGLEGKDRRRDLTEQSQDPADLKVAPTSGGSAAYRRHLVEEVQPWVRNRYRTTDRSALLGESLAGLFVIETALRQPAAFTDYIAVSPSLWWNRENLSRQAERALRNGGLGGRRLWVSLADEGSYHPESKSSVERLVETLRKVNAPGLRWSFTPMPSETHATTYLPAATIAFRSLFAKPKALKN